MATITSAQTGNFADGATWVGGVAPGVLDTAVVATGHVVTIAANATCVSVTKIGTGKFVLGNGVTLSAAINAANAAGYCVEFSGVIGEAAYIVGDVTGCAVASAHAVGNLATGTLTITGNVLAGNAQYSYGAHNVSSGILRVIGSCTGCSTNYSAGVCNGGFGLVQVTGEVRAGAGLRGAGGVSNSYDGDIDIVGPMYAHVNGAGALYSETISGLVTLTGPFYTAGTKGITSNRAVGWIWNNAVTNTTFLQVPTATPGNYYNLVTQDSVAGTPAVGDVRFGTTFGVGDVLTGTMRVPDVGSVALGVPVDNTVGTAILTAAAIRAELATELACLDVAVSTRNATAPPSAADNLAALTASDLGLRLANASTVETTGAQLAAALSP